MIRPLAALVVIVALAGPAFAQQWGTVKGQVVWGGPAAPARAPVKLMNCQAKGPVLEDELLVDAKTLGVKHVLVWLAPAGNNPLPIHNKLRAVPKEAVVIDQPCCLFEQRVVALRAGQTLVVKNSSKDAHSAMITGAPGINKAINTQIPPKGQIELKGDDALRAERRPMSIACSIHGWMRGKIGVFDHPYFAVTGEDGTFEIKDAPAGEVIIFILHERGWLQAGRNRNGQKVTIPVNGTLDLSKIKM